MASRDSMFIDAEVYESFITFVKERERIRKLKASGVSFPWTEDEILQRYKFTNVWRQDDAVTKSIQSRLKECESISDVLLSIFCLRLINRKEVIDNLVLPTLSKCLDDEYKLPEFIWGDAFIVLPHLPKGSKKKDILEKLLNIVARRLENGISNFETIFEMSRVKKLVLYEMMCDVWQFYGLEEMYCNIGGGAKPTLKMLYPNQEINEKLVADLAERMYQSGIVHEVYEKPTMRCAEGMCCEFRKYLNLKDKTRKTRKRIYYL